MRLSSAFKLIEAEERCSNISFPLCLLLHYVGETTQWSRFSGPVLLLPVPPIILHLRTIQHETSCRTHHWMFVFKFMDGINCDGDVRFDPNQQEINEILFQ